ncbi:VanW family protein [Paenactinomyces guangxiensis]|uniref:VanW family protein n=1 Tax=Paenactinomyces guangxiensis TaxID=1490290 RepID=A0A7W1WNS4_9BACL|nr:VanW family protein [Paenactinomyces guangxiensis]MBA4493284.1 VanW family protein [Paenactinomyces guangxiensis]MBH8589865.1 VanW family protein [Paenactinomyces guangxiensis]
MLTWKKIAWIYLMINLFFVCWAGDSAAGDPAQIYRNHNDKAKLPRASYSYSPLFIVQYEGKRWTLNLSDVGFDGIDPTTLDRGAFMDWFHLVVEKEVNRPARSAYYRQRKIIPHQLGRAIDREQVDQWLEHIHQYINHPVDLPVIWSKPPVSTEKLKQLKEKRLGAYTTFFNPVNKNRSHNILLSTAEIDHYVLLPGQIFSFNRVVGKRSVEKGYRRAKIIVKGEYSEGVGGGICQTSSTLFNSVDQAGLRIIQRVSHSKQVTYVPKHRDATVSWGGPDFKFQNQLNEPILIVGDIKNGTLHISIYGPKSTHYQPRYVAPSPKFNQGRQSKHPEEVEE